jgi:hypothetical protein
MANTVIQLKKSATPSAAPSSLAFGELAINYADGVLYYKSSNTAIASFYSRNPSYGTINAAGTLLIADTVNDFLTINQGTNIEITGDAINDALTINANLTPANNWANTINTAIQTQFPAVNNYTISVGAAANNWANTKLSNTSGITFAGSLTFTGNVTTSQTMFAQHFDNVSDMILKDNIQPITDPMITLSQLNPVSFNWKNTTKTSYGLIAQEVEEILPDIITVREDGIKTLSYIDIISFLIAAVKEHREDINKLNRRIDDLTSK